MGSFPKVYRVSIAKRVLLRRDFLVANCFYKNVYIALPGISMIQCCWKSLVVICSEMAIFGLFRLLANMDHYK